MAESQNAKPTYVDTHIHLDYIMDRMEKPLSEFGSLLDTHFRSAPLVKGKAVELSGSWEACVHITCDPVTFANARTLIEHDNIYVGAGVHPHHAKDYTDEVEEALKSLHKLEKVKAWGEMGLDYHYNQSPPDIQKQVFARQLQCAVELGKPLIIHTREAEDDTLRILTEHVPSDWNIHIHCFTSSLTFAQQLMQHFPNLVLGFTGVITFGNAKDVQNVVSNTPLERMVLETDGPFLAPTPFRGLPATSGMIPKIADKIAEIKSVDVAEVYRHARANTKRIYGI